MKKTLILTFACFLVVALSFSCRGKVEQEAPPPPPQEEEQPEVEKVKEPPEPKEPELTEEEIFEKKSLEKLNEEQPLEMIHFDFDKYAIKDNEKPILQRNADWLKKWDSVKVLIEGHCDERGTEEYNLALGEKRAKATFDYLVSLGISPDRMKTISYGESQPLDKASNETAWAKNRRAQFTVIEK